MQVSTGTVKDGKIVMDGVPLVEGSLVTVVSRGSDEAFTLSSAEEDALIESLAQIDKGDFVTLEALLKTLPGSRAA